MDFVDTKKVLVLFKKRIKLRYEIVFEHNRSNGEEKIATKALTEYKIKSFSMISL